MTRVQIYDHQNDLCFMLMPGLESEIRNEIHINTPSRLYIDQPFDR